MQRILHIVGGMDRAGAETMIMNLYRNIDRSKFQFDFLYFIDKKCDYDEEILTLGGEIHRLVTSNPIKRHIATYNFLRENPHYTIVHAHTLFNIGPNLLAAKLAGVKNRIAHSHNTSDQAIKNKFIRTIYQSFSKLLIKRSSTYNIACGIEAGVFLFGNNKAFILYNGIDIDQYSKIAKENTSYVRDVFNIDTSTTIFIQVGRLMDVKNHKFSLQLMKKLRDSGNDFKFLIVGQGPLEDQLKREVKLLGLTDKIIFTGIRDDVPLLMAGSDIMLMPSLYEGFPVVLVESQAVGLSSIISDNISVEVDLNINLIKFLSLKKMDEWVLGCKKNYDKKLNSEALKEKGFDVISNVNILEKIYKQMK